MKKIILFSVLFSFFISHTFAQEAYTAENDSKIKIVATPVLTEDRHVIRKLELVDKETNEVFQTIYNEIVSANESGTIEENLKKGTFSGYVSFQLMNGDKNVEVLHQVIDKNALVSEASFRLNGTEEMTAEFSAAGRCTIKTIHDCVAKKIDDMNWVEYVLCCASAPECYAGLWLICDWDVCHAKKA